MKRFPFVIGSTIAGLAGVLSFHSRATTGPLSHSVPVKAGTSARPAPAKPGSTETTAPRSSVAHSAPTSTVPVTTQGPPTAASATGVNEQYGYGVLSVRATVSGSRITDVQVVNLQTVDSYSQQLADQVIPYLRRQVLSMQTARIDGVSGATYTSEAYAYSLQSALDKLHFR